MNDLNLPPEMRIYVRPWMQTGVMIKLQRRYFFFWKTVDSIITSPENVKNETKWLIQAWVRNEDLKRRAREISGLYS